MRIFTKEPFLRKLGMPMLDRWKTAALTYPTVHLNGTSRNALQDQVHDAMQSLRKAIESLQDAAPHGRDYYPQGGDAIRKATKEHVSRLERLESVRDELVELAEHLAGKYEDDDRGDYLDRKYVSKMADLAQFPTKARAETFLRRLLNEGTSGVKRDPDWRSISAIFRRLGDAGFGVQNMDSEYYRLPGSSNLNDGKRWSFEIPFTKGGWYVRITASFMGSAQDPSNAYDIVVTMDYSARIRPQV